MASHFYTLTIYLFVFIKSQGSSVAHFEMGVSTVFDNLILPNESVNHYLIWIKLDRLHRQVKVLEKDWIALVPSSLLSMEAQLIFKTSLWSQTNLPPKVAVGRLKMKRNNHVNCLEEERQSNHWIKSLKILFHYIFPIPCELSSLVSVLIKLRITILSFLSFQT